MPESTHPESPRQENALTVSPEEAGMKLLRFLERRLPQAPSQGVLHKWVRTGQVRLNGGRTKAFALLEGGDIVRVPPFALASAMGKDCGADGNSISSLELLAAEGITLVAATKNILVMNKPGGLAVQSGTGQGDSVEEKLKRAWNRHLYQPSPAHRLDRHTSGLLLAGLHHKAQQALHRSFADGGVTKDYLAWVVGSWPDNRPCLLVDSIHKTMLHTAEGKSREVMQAADGGQCLPTPNTWETHHRSEGDGEERREGHAAAVVLPVCFMSAAALAQAVQIVGSRHSGTENAGATLMLVRLLTGRTHQIRVQLASRGFPLIGDGRYGGPAFSRMLLHAWRVALSADLAGMESAHPTLPQARPTAQRSGDEAVFSVLPPWPPCFMPDEGELGQALEKLHIALRNEQE